MGLLLVSSTVVTKFCWTPWVMVPVVAPLAKVTEIDLGGQVEKYPADEPEPAMDAVMTVVPGCSAVISLFRELMEAMAALPTMNWRVPMVLGQVGMFLIEATVDGSGHAGLGFFAWVMLAGAQSSTLVSLPFRVPE